MTRALASGERKFYKFQQVERRTVLTLYRARPEDAPACIFWERVPARQVATLTRGLAQRGYMPLPAEFGGAS